MEVDTAVFGLVSWAGRGSQKRHGFNDGGRVWGDEPTPGGRDSWASLAALQDVAWGVTCGGVIGGPGRVVAWHAGCGLWALGLRGVACTGRGGVRPGAWSAGGGSGVACGCVACGRGPRGVWPSGCDLWAWPDPAGPSSFPHRSLGRQVPTCREVLGVEKGMHVHLLT